MERFDFRKNMLWKDMWLCVILNTVRNLKQSYFILFLFFTSCMEYGKPSIGCEFRNVQLSGNYINPEHFDEGVIVFLSTKIFNHSSDSIQFLPGNHFRYYLSQKADTLGSRPYLRYYGNKLEIEDVFAYGWNTESYVSIPPKTEQKLFLGIINEKLNKTCVPDCKDFLRELFDNSDLYLITLDNDTIKCFKRKPFKIVWGFPNNNGEIEKL